MTDSLNPLSNQMLEPQHVLAVLRLLQQSEGLSRDDVETSLLSQGAGQKARGRIAEALAALKTWQLATDARGAWEVPDELRDAPLVDRYALQRVVLQWIAAQSVDWFIKTDVGFPRILRVCAFLLLTNPLVGPYGYEQLVQLASPRKNQERVVVPNSTQWPALVSWATFLGALGGSQQSRVWVDPSAALASALETAWASRRGKEKGISMSIQDVRLVVAENLPWAPGGDWSKEIAAITRHEGEFDSVGFALLRLESRGQVVIETPEGADKRSTGRLSLLDGRDVAAIRWVIR